MLGKRIVTEQFLATLRERKFCADPFPREPEFQPTIKTENILPQHLIFDSRRKDLFHGLEFVFIHPLQARVWFFFFFLLFWVRCFSLASLQSEKTADIIKKAGGSYVCPLKRVQTVPGHPGSFESTGLKKKIRKKKPIALAYRNLSKISNPCVWLKIVNFRDYFYFIIFFVSRLLNRNRCGSY